MPMPATMPTILTRFAPAVLLAFMAAACGSASASADGNDETVDQTQDELATNRTFQVMRSGEGCTFKHHTLYAKRGGRVTFDNGAWLPNDTELTSDDNVSLLIEWPNALGEDNAAMFDITIGTKKSRSVPYLDDELYGDARSLDFDIYCIPQGDRSSGWGTPQAKIRIYR